MTKFSYRAKKGPHEIVRGILEASHAQDAVSKILQQGLSPIDVEVVQEQKIPSSARPRPTAFFARQRISKKYVIVFTRQLYDLLDAGIPLLRGLRLLAEQDSQKIFQHILRDSADIVQDGGSLSSALAQHPDVFSSLYIHLVRSGEQSGQLSVVLGRLADLLEKDQEVSQKVIASLAYPLLILGVGGATMFVLLSFVIPRLTEMFDELAQQLPWATVLVMSVSGFFSRFWWLILIFGAAIVASLKHLHAMPSQRVKFDTAKLRLPIIGDFLIKIELVRFAQTLATLLEGGVPIIEALRGVGSVIENHALRQDVDRLADAIAGGSSLTESLKKITFFPAEAINMVAVGEESGQLEHALAKIANAYERQTSQIMRTITSLLEPALIVLIGAVVGFMVVAMLLPIFQMNLIIQ